MTICSNGNGRVGGLNLCKNMHTFTGIAMIIDMNSNTASIAGLVYFTGTYIYIYRLLAYIFYGVAPN